MERQRAAGARARGILMRFENAPPSWIADLLPLSTTVQLPDRMSNERVVAERLMSAN
jgi:hypothetical protein